MEFEASHLLIAFVTYFVATASPGPAILAIMSIAMDKGRASALIFASGVLLGSFVWAMLSLFGIAALLAAHAPLLYWLKIFGGLYLLWLSFKSVKKVMNNNKEEDGRLHLGNKKLFSQGLALHVTNPKAIFTWVAIVTLALPQNAPFSMSLMVVLGCMLIGVFVFGGYAILFSTDKAQKAYSRFGQWFNGILALVFGVAGAKLLSSQTP